MFVRGPLAWELRALQSPAGLYGRALRQHQGQQSPVGACRRNHDGSKKRSSPESVRAPVGQAGAAPLATERPRPPLHYLGVEYRARYRFW